MSQSQRVLEHGTLTIDIAKEDQRLLAATLPRLWSLLWAVGPGISPVTAGWRTPERPGHASHLFSGRGEQGILAL